MASYTNSLRLTLPVTGTEDGTWGDTVNAGITTLIDTSIAGTAAITMVAANYTLTSNSGATDEARSMFLVIGGVPGASFSVICPSKSKLYLVRNNTAFAQTVKTSAGTGVSVAAGGATVLYCDGTNVVNAITLLSALSLGTALTVPNGGTGVIAVPASYVPYGAGTGPLASSANLQFDGTVMRVGSNALLGGTTNPVAGFTGGTNNYIQTYVYNATAGISSSSDLVAYANNSTDAHGWADMGFTSSAYADVTYTVTGPNEAYLFGSALNSTYTGNLVYATDSTGSANAHQWYVGGFTQAKGAWKMQLTATGLQLATALAVASGGTGAASLAAASIVTYTGAETLTNKTITNLVFDGNYTEDVYAIVDGASVDLDPANGTVQTWTLGASRSPTAASFAAGQSITLMVDDGTAYAITWPSVVWKTNAGVAPTLNATGYTAIQLWKINSTLFGARVGDA